jgi:hypothetical protein
LRRRSGRSRLLPPCCDRVSVLFAMTANGLPTQRQGTASQLPLTLFEKREGY